MKAVPLTPMESVLLSDNGFTKIFKVRGDIDLFLTKAFDEDSNKHYIVSTIREIVELNASGIQFPYEYSTDYERDNAYKQYGTEEARVFVEFSIHFIKDKEKFKEEEAEKIRLRELGNQNESPSNNN